MTTKTEELRKLFVKMMHTDGEIQTMPVAPDALAAKIAEHEGFTSIYAAGYATNASDLAQPDRGFADFGIMLNKAREIINAVNVPVFCDADTGYGDADDIARTVRAFEDIGAAGVFIEDQVWPKRCGHMNGKQCVPEEVMLARLKAAIDARTDPNFLIMSRTDEIAIEGYDEAVKRTHDYIKAGVDMTFLEAPQNVEMLEAIPKEFEGVPQMANMIQGGKTPIESVEQLRKFGFKIVVVPNDLVYSITYTYMHVLKDLKATGKTTGHLDQMVPFPRFNKFIGLDEVNARENMYTAEKMKKQITDWEKAGEL